MRKAILALPFVLVGCSTTPTVQGDATACLAALVSAGVAGGVVAIPAAALATPACFNLASDVISALIGQATTTATATRRTMGLHP